MRSVSTRIYGRSLICHDLDATQRLGAQHSEITSIPTFTKHNASMLDLVKSNDKL